MQICLNILGEYAWRGLPVGSLHKGSVRRGSAWRGICMEGSLRGEGSAWGGGLHGRRVVYLGRPLPL